MRGAAAQQLVQQLVQLQQRPAAAALLGAATTAAGAQQQQLAGALAAAGCASLRSIHAEAQVAVDQVAAGGAQAGAAAPEPQQQQQQQQRQPAGTSSSSTSSGGNRRSGSGNGGLRRTPGTRGGQADRGTDTAASQQRDSLLSNLGLMVPRSLYNQLPPRQQARIQHYRDAAQRLTSAPAANMAAVVINPHQLQVVVSALADAPREARQQQQQAASKPDGSRAGPQQLPRVHQVLAGSSGSRQLLSPSNLMRVNSSSKMVNLNLQMRNAAAERRLGDVVQLFDALLLEGMAAATKQQQQQGSGPSGPALLVLPDAYRPDFDALHAYSHAMLLLGERASWRQGSNEQLHEDQKQRMQAQGAALLESARRVASLWGRDHDADPKLARMGTRIHACLIAAARAAGDNQLGVEYFEAVQDRRAEVREHSWRLHFQATAAALGVGNIELADRWGRVLTAGDVLYSADDYRARIAGLFRRLTAATANSRMWDASIFWLQELLNKEALQRVDPPSFLAVMRAAAQAGRMEYVKVMMRALDDQLQLQKEEPYVYTQHQLIDLLRAAGGAGDAPLVGQLWQRLLRDVQRRAAGAEQLGNRGSADASADAADEASSSAAAGSDDEAGSTSAGDGSGGAAAASPAAHLAVIKAYLACGSYGSAFDHVAELEAAYPRHPATSAFHGLQAFAGALGTEAALTAAFAQLQERKAQGKPVSTAMLNVLARAVARLGSTEATSRVFESYGAVWGLAPDADSYNAVMESCSAAGKVAAVEGLLSYMDSKGVPPNAASWNLLLATAVNAGDSPAIAGALGRMQAHRVLPSIDVALRAARYAQTRSDGRLQQLLRRACDALHGQPELQRTSRHKLGALRQLLHQRSHGQGRGASGQQQQQRQQQQDTWNVWRPGMPAGQQQQQQQQQSGSQHGGSSSADEQQGGRSRSAPQQPRSSNGSSSSTGPSQEAAGGDGNGASARLAGLRALLQQQQQQQS